MPKPRPSPRLPPRGDAWGARLGAVVLVLALLPCGGAAWASVDPARVPDRRPGAAPPGPAPASPRPLPASGEGEPGAPAAPPLRPTQGRGPPPRDGPATGASSPPSS